MKGTRNQATLVVLIAALLATSIAARLGLGITTEPWSLLFHGIPALLAVAIIFWDEATTSFGRLIRAVTIGLLLVSVVTGEGTICVIIAAPLVYGVALLVWLITRQVAKHRHHSAALLAAALVMSAFSGAAPPSEISTTVLVAMSPDAALQRLAGSLTIEPLRGGLLTSGVPQMVGVAGTGVEHGDLRVMDFSDGTSVEMQVVESNDDVIHLEMVENTTMTSDWLRWTTARFEIAEAQGGVTITMILSYELLLDPAWYFSPIVDAAAGEAAAHVLAQVFTDV